MLKPFLLPGSVRAVATDHFLRLSQLRAVVNEEATHAGELILLFRSDLNGEFNMGEVGAGKLSAASVSSTSTACD